MPTVGSLAELVSGTVIGDSSVLIENVAELQQAGPRHITFLANPKYLKQLGTTEAGAVLVKAAHDTAPCTQIVCGDPYLAMAEIAQLLHPRSQVPCGIETGAHVHATAKIDAKATIRMGAIVDAEARVGPGSVIEPGAYVGPRAIVGHDVLMHSGSRLLAECVLEDRVILQAGAIIGSDGFGYAADGKGGQKKIPQIGIVVIEADVEIGANTTVDRATFSETRIGRGTKIDNQVQIAHNVIVGEECIIVSQSGIAGSAKLGKHVVMGAQSGVLGHIEVTDSVMLAGRGGVTNHIKKPGIYAGAPAIDHKKWLRVVTSQNSLPELRRRVRRLEQQQEEPEDAS